MNYYNEHDPKAAAWLRELISAGLIPPGQVDTRSIAEVSIEDLHGFTQCHFFAGIGGWSLALQLAGWPDDREIWTGSCPCQPFSSAGLQLGVADPRHLWPEFFRLIHLGTPATVFGEQVASKAGRGWLAGVFADLENVGYAVAGADLCAAGVGAPHIRQRLFWVADADFERWLEGDRHDEFGRISAVGGASPVGGMADPAVARLAGAGQGEADLGDGSDHLPQRRDSLDEFAGGGPTGRVDDADSNGTVRPRGAQSCAVVGRAVSGVDHSLSERRGEGGSNHAGHVGIIAPTDGRTGRLGDAPLPEGSRLGQFGEHLSGQAAFWDAFDLIPCADGKARRVEPGTFPLAHGVSGRVGLLRGYGNAIVPEAAAEFVMAWMECKS